MQKYQLVVFKNGNMIVISDDEINKDDLAYTKKNGRVSLVHSYIGKHPDLSKVIGEFSKRDFISEMLNRVRQYHEVMDNSDSIDEGHDRLISMPKLPSIDLSNLSNEDCNKIGLINIENTAKEKIDEVIKSGEFVCDINQEIDLFTIAFEKGFNYAKSLYENKFSLEDMKYIYNPNHDVVCNTHPDTKIGVGTCSCVDRRIVNLPQKHKVFDIEIKKEYLSNDGNWKEALLPSEWGENTNIRLKVISIIKNN